MVQANVEECDLGADNADIGACTTSCRNAVCGDGFKTGESAGDDDQVNTDECLSNCKLATQGDGYVQVGVEQCDDGNQIVGQLPQ